MLSFKVGVGAIEIKCNRNRLCNLIMLYKKLWGTRGVYGICFENPTLGVIQME